MAISTGGGGETPMSDINTTPLVDVMLVLLIIFLIAVPVAIQTIEKLKIPIFESVESKDKVENLLLTVSTTDDAGPHAALVDTGLRRRDPQRRVPGLLQQHHAGRLDRALRPGVRAARRDRAARGRRRGADGRSRD